MKKIILAAALCLASSSGVFASVLCDTYGETARGFAIERDKGTPEQTLLNKINAPTAGGLSEANKPVIASLLNLAYKRTDLSPMEIYLLVQTSCNAKEEEAMNKTMQDIARKVKSGG